MSATLLPGEPGLRGLGEVARGVEGDGENVCAAISGAVARRLLLLTNATEPLGRL